MRTSPNRSADRSESLALLRRVVAMVHLEPNEARLGHLLDHGVGHHSPTRVGTWVREHRHAATGAQRPIASTTPGA